MDVVLYEIIYYCIIKKVLYRPLKHLQIAIINVSQTDGIHKLVIIVKRVIPRSDSAHCYN